MRGFTRLLAVAAAAAGMLTLPGSASAADVSIMALPPGCTGSNNGSTYAEAVCDARRYRVSVEYCRTGCGTEKGNEAKRGQVSRISFPPGGSIVSFSADILEW